MIKAIIFDSDGMLAHGPRFSDTYAKEFEIPIEEMIPFFTGPFQECVIGKADLKQELQKGWIERWKWTKSADDLLKYWFEVGDVLDHEVFGTVGKLRAKGIPCVLATNQERYRSEYLSEKFEYNDVFDRVFSSSAVGHKKPSPEFFEIIFSYLRERDSTIQKPDVLFWDDDMENVDGARAVGFEARQFIDARGYIEEMQHLELL